MYAADRANARCPENEVAKKLYASFGFMENGEKSEEEMVAVLKL